MKLTDSQEEVYKKLRAFIKGEANNCFILKGYAGTGKSFLIKFTAEFCTDEDIHFKLLAPTGRAARILNLRTGFEVSTIHSEIYSQAVENFTDQTEQDSIFFNLRQHINKETIFIIDEASLISDQQNNDKYLEFGSGKLLSDFIDYTGVRNNPKVKIIFVGDPAQLPPVKSPLSPALSEEYLFNKFNLSVKTAELKKIIRQKAESGILLNAAKIRKSITGREFNKLSINTGKGVEHITDNFEQVIDKLFVTSPDDDSVCIASTNFKVFEYNKFIRNRIFEYGNDDIQENDKLLITVNNTLYMLLNGDIVNVSGVNSNKEIKEVQLKRRKEKINLVFRDVELNYQLPNKEEINISCKIIENLLYSPRPTLSKDEKTALYVETVQRLNLKFPPKALREADPVLYNKLKDEFFLKLRSDKYYNALVVKFGYALTCHKAQGGEWENVIVDFKGYGPPASDNYFRWAYTAVTRAKKKLYCISAPKISHLNNAAAENKKRKPFIADASITIEI